MTSCYFCLRAAPRPQRWGSSQGRGDDVSAVARPRTACAARSCSQCPRRPRAQGSAQPAQTTRSKTSSGRAYSLLGIYRRSCPTNEEPSMDVPRERATKDADGTTIVTHHKRQSLVLAAVQPQSTHGASPGTLDGEQRRRRAPPGGPARRVPARVLEQPEHGAGRAPGVARSTATPVGGSERTPDDRDGTRPGVGAATRPRPHRRRQGHDRAAPTPWLLD